MQLRGIVLKFSGRSDLAEQGLTAAIEAARRSGDDVSHVRCLVALASIRADDGDAAASRRLCDEALLIARRTHDVGVQRSAYLNLLRALVAQGELTLAVAAAQEAMDLSPRYTSVGEEQALTEARFVLALMAGELGTAFDAAPALLDVSRRAGELWRRVSGLLAPVDAWLLLGTGYGIEEDWRFGMYQGPDEVVQVVDIDYERDAERLFGLVDQVGRFTQHGGVADGSVGHGLHEFFFVDTFSRYGLSGWDPTVAKQWVDPDS